MTSGTVIKSADGAVGTAGSPIRVFSVNLVSGGTAGVLVLRNGTTASDPVYFQVTGTVSVGVVFDIQDGMFFPDGCFYDHDANFSHVAITYSVER